jgi:hypothetical protein
MTSSEVILLQGELHKLAEQNREDHKLVREALTKLQGDIDGIGKRLQVVEKEEHADNRVEADRVHRRRQFLALVGTVSAVAGVISGIIVAVVH